MSIFDHAKAVWGLLKSGVDCYMSKGTAEKLNVRGHHRAHLLWPGRSVPIGDFKVVPFEVEHDAAEPLGFFIRFRGNRIVYLTDTAYSQYKFPGMTHQIIEANFDEDIIRQKAEDATIAVAHKRRVWESHMSIQRVVSLLEANKDMSNLQEIILCHLSDGNSDEIAFKETIQKTAGCLVRIAGKG